MLSVIFTLQLSAQTGKYDLNFALSHVDCDNEKLYIDIQIKAHNAESTFRLSDQNYRIIFNNTLTGNGVFIEQELEISGFIESSTGYSFYKTHTLTGSSDDIVSYNIEFVSGEGLLIMADEWTNVGQIRFDIVDIEGTVNLMYMGTDAFPPTFIGEFYNNTRLAALAGHFASLEVDLRDYCIDTDVVNPEIENNVQLFPTLAKDQIYLRCGDNIYGDLGIIDVQGHVIRHWQKAQNTTLPSSFDISALPSGIYFLQININGYYLTRRFVKI